MFIPLKSTQKGQPKTRFASFRKTSPGKAGSKARGSSDCGKEHSFENAATPKPNTSDLHFTQILLILYRSSQFLKELYLVGCIYPHICWISSLSPTGQWVLTWSLRQKLGNLNCNLKYGTPEFSWIVQGPTCDFCIREPKERQDTLWVSSGTSLQGFSLVEVWVGQCKA